MRTSTKMCLIAAIVLSLLLILAIPVLADPRVDVCGGDPACQINLFSTSPFVYPAGKPFFISHGNGNVPSFEKPVAIAHTGFYLEIDGVYIEPDWVRYSAGSAREGEGNIVWSLAHFNFPQGMTGTHTFTGYWYTTCGAWLDTCEHPMDPLVYWTQDLIVTFVP